MCACTRAGVHRLARCPKVPSPPGSVTFAPTHPANFAKPFPKSNSRLGQYCDLSPSQPLSLDLYGPGHTYLWPQKALMFWSRGGALLCREGAVGLMPTRDWHVRCSCPACEVLRRTLWNWTLCVGASTVLMQCHIQLQCDEAIVCARCPADVER